MESGICWFEAFSFPDFAWLHPGFSKAAPNVNYRRFVLTNAITMNLRFPGQYYDQESGFHYNYYRDYDPEVGRYVEADPIGLRGGANTYVYVADNPLLYIDPYGQNVLAICGVASAADGPAPFGEAICVCYTVYRGVRLLLNVYSMAEADGCGGGGGGGIGNNCGDPCPAIQRQIDALVADLRSREQRMLIDEYMLYYDYRTIKLAHEEYGSWEGHQIRYRYIQSLLKEAIVEAKLHNCSYNPEADRWASEPPPRKPWGAK